MSPKKGELERDERAAVPPRLVLPSGENVRIDARALDAARARLEPGIGCVAAAFALLSEPGVLVARVTVSELPLADLLVLAGVLAKGGYVPEREVEIACDNCGELLRVRPSRALELGPFEDAELDDPELDAPFDFGSAHPIPAVFTSAGVARSIKLSPRAAGEARWLFEGGEGALPLARATVIALGVAALGRERKSAGIARALAQASGDAWTAIGELWERAHYGGRLFSDVACPSCGARNTVLAPDRSLFDRVASPEGAPRGGDDLDGFPTLSEFESEAERARKNVYAARHVRNVDLCVDAGVPACDEGGEPLLGMYEPPSHDVHGASRAPTITLFYRSFQSEFRRDPTFDVAHEIFVTIDHEVEHHLFFLSGHDPMDEEERAEIVREKARIVGKRELGRRGAREAVGDLVGFARIAWPIAAAVAALTLIRNCLH